MKNQRGVTFIGMIFIAGLIVMGAIIALKLVPIVIGFLDAAVAVIVLGQV